MVVLAQTEGKGQLRLREIARTTLHYSRPGNTRILNTHGSADRIAVRLGAEQSKTDAVVARALIVAE